MAIQNIVIIIDIGNYKSSCSEETPFKAELFLTTDYPCFWVRSLVTGKEYELYENQILEFLSINEIKELIIK